MLIAGLAIGILAPGLALWASQWLQPMIVMLLIVSAFRIGHRKAFGALSDLKWGLPAVLVLQLLVPIIVLIGFLVFGLSNSHMALAIVLACSAPTISGGAALAIILKQDPARMMQLLVLGMLAFPFTVGIVLWLFPSAIDTAQIALATLKALVVIFGSAAVGFMLRHMFVPTATQHNIDVMDGVSVFVFAAIVIGLMAALGPELRTNPIHAATWILAAFLLSFGLQTATLLLLKSGPLRIVSGALALAAGNRNIALFLVALPKETMAPIMIFVACWQLPMYLTPVLLPKLYALAPRHE